MARSRLVPVDASELDATSPELSAHPAHDAEADSPFAKLLFLSLKSLSQRAVVALSSLVDLAMIASAFVLWLNVMSGPTTLQLVGLGMYACFILAALWAKRR